MKKLHFILMQLIIEMELACKYEGEKGVEDNAGQPVRIQST